MYAYKISAYRTYAYIRVHASVCHFTLYVKNKLALQIRLNLQHNTMAVCVIVVVLHLICMHFRLGCQLPALTLNEVNKEKLNENFKGGSIALL